MLRILPLLCFFVFTDGCAFDTGVSHGAPGDNGIPDARPGEAADAPGSGDGGSAVDGDLTGDAMADALGASCFDPAVQGEAFSMKMGNASCTSWSTLEDLEGEVVLTRNGAMLSVEFESGPLFVGTIVGDTVTLFYSRPEDTDDGCLWQADEGLTGVLNPDTCELSLSYDYLESVIVSNGDCDFACNFNGGGSVDIVPGSASN